MIDLFVNEHEMPYDLRMSHLYRWLKIRRFLELEKTLRSEVDVDLIHEHGCTFDTSGLPHHISEHDEMECYIAEMTEILSRLKMKSKIITIARYKTSYKYQII